jgi:hypothetical protein
MPNDITASFPRLAAREEDVRPCSRPKLTLALLAGVAFLALPGRACAGYVADLGLDSSPTIGAGFGGSGWAGNDSPTRPDDSGRPAIDDGQPLVLLSALLQPSAHNDGGSGMGGTGGSDSGGTGQQFGLASAMPLLFAQAPGRLFLIYVYHLPPPFPTRLFHPPRSL